MVDDNKDDEYQFSELDGSQVFDEDAKVSDIKTSMPAENNLRKFILIGFAILVVVFLAYKFLGSQFLSSKKTNQQQKLTDKAPVSAVQNNSLAQSSKPDTSFQQPPPISKPQQTPTVVYSEPQVQTVTKTVTDPKVSQKIASLQDETQQTARAVNRVTSNMDVLDRSMTTLNSKLTEMNANLAILAQEVKNQQGMLMKLKQKPKKQRIKRGLKSSKPVYYIQAAIPGRAWLKSTKGITITVVEGTMVKGYGRVKVIDPHQGQVVLSSGRVIKFSASDT